MDALLPAEETQVCTNTNEEGTILASLYPVAAALIMLTIMTV
jgi:hypothetical protein